MTNEEQVRVEKVMKELYSIIRSYLKESGLTRNEKDIVCGWLSVQFERSISKNSKTKEGEND
jgi:hypothetical protein